MTYPPETDEEREARTGLSSLEQGDQAAAAVQQTEHRVTLDSIKDKIASTEYLYPTSIGHLTVCVILLENGFAVVGKSAPADPENFNKALGEKFAYEDALRQIWQFEGYALRERMSL